MIELTAKQYSENYKTVIEILNDWKFLQELPLYAIDNYDYLTDVIVSILPNLRYEDVLEDIIYIKLNCHYGIEGEIPVEEISKQLLDWWKEHSK